MQAEMVDGSYDGTYADLLDSVPSQKPIMVISRYITPVKMMITGILVVRRYTNKLVIS